ncbi:MAG: phosphoribosylaminoimidazolecarboxamide formyltransferase, partial [Pseudomonadota bacterium]
PGYTDEAIKILMKKQKGSYRMIEVDPNFVPPETVSQQIMGVTLEQKRNDYVPTHDDLTNVVTANKEIPDSVKNDMMLAQITLKYTQSNSVCLAYDGQIIGVGAGQQSRVHCTRLASGKAATWFLRQHPRVMELPFREKIGRPERDNVIDQFLLPSLSPNEENFWLQSFSSPPVRLTQEEKMEWLGQQSGVTLGSDAFFPFRDSIDCAAQYGVSYVIQPGGSIRDDVVTEACNEYGMAMVCNGMRLFHH